MNTINPLALLDQILDDWASPRTRRLLHALLGLVIFVASAALAVDGNWQEAVVGVLLALYAAANKANTPATALTPAGGDTEPDDGLSYEQAGGAIYPSESSVESEFPNSETLYQPGEKEYERFGTQDDFVQTNDVSGNESIGHDGGLGDSWGR